MKENQEEEITREEIKKEFQLERMILFSDAVFAIVITLMAIEIKLPDAEMKFSAALLPIIAKYVLPSLLAYAVSFIFIGVIWYQHLTIFSLVKDYDKGLVVRNLVLLFFIGLFPFCASIVTRAKGEMVAMFIYLGIIMCCIISQYSLYHYIVIKRPALRINTDLTLHLEELRKRKISLICFSGAALLTTITYLNVSDPVIKSLSTLWMVVFPIVYKVLVKKKK
jgi:uncharacterized membrane protein